MPRTVHAHSDVRSFVFSLAALILAGILVLAGCDIIGVEDDDEDQAPIEAVAISPDSVAIEVGEQVDFSVAALTAAGDTVQDADLSIRWWSTDTTVFTVEEDGLATGQGSGTAYCVVEASEEADDERAGKAATSNLTRRPNVPIGLDSAVVHLF